MTNVQFVDLFPNHQLIFMGAINGAHDSSAGVQQLIKFAHDQGFRRQWSYFILAAAHVFTLINTFYFLPSGFMLQPSETPKNVASIDNGETSDNKNIKVYNNKAFMTESSDSHGNPKTEHRYHSKTNESNEANNSDFVEIKNNVENNIAISVDCNQDTYDRRYEQKENSQKNEQMEKPSLKECVMSPLFLSHTIWCSLLNLRFFFFLNTLNPFLERIFDQDKALVSTYTDISTNALLLGFFMCTGAGWICGVCSKLASEDHTKPLRNALSTSIPFMISNTLCLILSGLILIETPLVLYPVFILLVLFRSFFNTVSTAFISMTYPTDYFAPLLGIVLLVTGATNTVSYGLYHWVEVENFYTVNLFLLIMICFCFFHPLNILWSNWNLSQRNNRNVNLN